MNALHSAFTAAFDVLLDPLRWMGDVGALVLVSGVFGVLALILFKQISWQAGIRATKNKIKGHMIAIRIYQDDLGVVFGSVVKILLRNLQYLTLNFGPIVPLFIPFTLIAAQLVVRYAFDPLPVIDQARLDSMLPGQGTMVEVRMRSGHTVEVEGLTIELPPHVKALSPIARSSRDGVAVLEIAAIGSGTADMRFAVHGQPAGTKSISAGEDRPRSLQPERVSDFWESWLWPAEATFPSTSPIDSVRFAYPDRDLGYLPSGVLGVLVTFLVASLLFGIAILKPLNIQI